MRLRIGTLIVFAFLLCVHLVADLPKQFHQNAFAILVAYYTAGSLLPDVEERIELLGKDFRDRVPDHLPVERLFAILYLQANEPKEALGMLGSPVPICPDPVTCFLRGRAFSQLGLRAEALVSWRSVPGVDVHFAFTGDALYALGRTDEALEQYAVSNEIDPAITPAKQAMFLNLCREYRGRKDLAQAVLWCEKARLAVSDYWSLIELGRTYIEVGQVERSTELLETAVSLLPGEPAAYQWLGVALHQLGRTNEGLLALDTIIQLDPYGVWVRMERARILATNGDYQGAYCDYYKAFKLAKSPSERELALASLDTLPKADYDSRTCPN